MSFVIPKITPAQAVLPKVGYFTVFLNSEDGNKLYSKDHLGALTAIGADGVDKVGDLTGLETDTTADAVSAINEVLGRTTSVLSTKTFVVDLVLGNDTNGEKGKFPFATIDAVIPLLGMGDVVYVRSGNHSVSSNMFVDGVTWVFDPNGGSVGASFSTMFNDDGLGKIGKVIAPDWDFTSFTYLGFLTGSSFLDITCRDFISLGNLSLFHASNSASNFFRLKAGQISGVSYVLSMRGYSNGEITAEGIFGLSATYGMFFRNNGADEFSGTYTINCPDATCASGGATLYATYAEPESKITINGRMHMMNGGSPIVWGGVGTLTINGELEASTGACVYTNASGGLMVMNCDMKTNQSNSTTLYLDSFAGTMILKNNRKIVANEDGVVTQSAILIYPTPTTKLIIENNFRIETDGAGIGLDLSNMSQGDCIIENGLTIYNDGATGLAVKCGVTPPNIVLKGLLMSNVADDGTTYAFDALASAGATSGRVTNSLIN